CARTRNPAKQAGIGRGRLDQAREMQRIAGSAREALNNCVTAKRGGDPEAFDFAGILDCFASQ
ncbi:MAG: hypothetical protein Q8N48_00070, partial [Thiobacillus sp.]|nr:hypothetical protein [Thiobacillus sp.]